MTIFGERKTTPSKPPSANDRQRIALDRVIRLKRHTVTRNSRCQACGQDLRGGLPCPMCEQ